MLSNIVDNYEQYVWPPHCFHWWGFLNRSIRLINKIDQSVNKINQSINTINELIN
jgi:hypothetical protein